MYKTRVIDSVAQFSSLERGWDKLLPHSKNPTVFNTSAWASCWLQIYWQPDYTLQIIVVEAGDDIVALLPLYIQRQSGTCWFVGSGEPEAEEVASEYLDFIVHEDHANSAALASCITAQLDTLKKYRLQFVNCCASSYVVNFLRNHRRALHAVVGNVYKLPIKQDFAATSLRFSKNQQKKARQCLNRFNAAPDLEYVSFHDTAFEESWHSLQTLHQQDWTSRGKAGAFHSGKFSNFHALMHSEYPQIKQAFVELKQQDATLAIHHFYILGASYYFYLAGTEKKREARLSPGLMLHALTMQDLSGQEVIYDFLKGATGNSSYKAKFCGSGEPFYDITVFEDSARGVYRYWLTRLKNHVRKMRSANTTHKRSREEGQD